MGRVTFRSNALTALLSSVFITLVLGPRIEPGAFRPLRPRNDMDKILLWIKQFRVTDSLWHPALLQ